MALSENIHHKLAVLLVIGLLAWIVELVGVVFLQRSCTYHTLNTWQTGAQLPAAPVCRNVYRWIWWSIFIELPIVVGLGSSLYNKAGSNASLKRYRFSWIALLTIATVLQMWSANVMLNLTDSVPAALTGHTERTRAWVSFIGFIALSAVNFLLIFSLGDDGGSTAQNSSNDPLLSDSTL